MASASTKGLDELRALYARVTPGIYAASVEELDAEADELIAAQKARVHVRSGATRDSIRKESGKDDLEVLVVAGGASTTRSVGTRTYEREVRLGSGDTRHIAKKEGGAGVAYDYALGEEFGNEHTSAHPFFYGPYRQLRRAFVRRRVAAARKAVEQLGAMIADPSIAIQRAVVAALTGSAPLQALIGAPARVYDRVPAAAALPYVTVGADEVHDNSAEQLDGAEVVAIVKAWSGVSKAEAKSIIALCVAALAIAPDLSVDGQRCTSVLVESLHHLDGPDGETFQSIASVAYQTEPAS